jgi:hypothetical protein
MKVAPQSELPMKRVSKLSDASIIAKASCLKPERVPGKHIP